RRWPRTTIHRWAYVLAVPVLAGLLLTPGPLAWTFIALASIVLYVPFSLHVTLGQDYLPNHMGTARGVTLGLAVSVGGLASPIIGNLADHNGEHIPGQCGLASPIIGNLADHIGLEYAVLPLIGLPLIGFLVLIGLRDPRAATSVATSEKQQNAKTN